MWRAIRERWIPLEGRCGSRDMRGDDPLEGPWSVDFRIDGDVADRRRLVVSRGEVAHDTAADNLVLIRAQHRDQLFDRAVDWFAVNRVVARRRTPGDCRLQETEDVGAGELGIGCFQWPVKPSRKTRSQGLLQVIVGPEARDVGSVVVDSDVDKRMEPWRRNDVVCRQRLEGSRNERASSASEIPVVSVPVRHHMGLSRRHTMEPPRALACDQTLAAYCRAPPMDQPAARLSRRAGQSTALTCSNSPSSPLSGS